MERKLECGDRGEANVDLCCMTYGLCGKGVDMWAVAGVV